MKIETASEQIHSIIARADDTDPFVVYPAGRDEPVTTDEVTFLLRADLDGALLRSGGASVTARSLEVKKTSKSFAANASPKTIDLGRLPADLVDEVTKASETLGIAGLRDEITRRQD